ncbi:MAG: DNA glycosylase AlkZ-like family protein [Gaiellales bacterium]
MAAHATARIRRMRATAQLLAGPPARGVATVPRQLLALQAQDLRAARLAVRARSTGISAAGVNDALDRREVVIGWLCRGTLHMVDPEDYSWLLGLTGPPQRQANARRLLQEGFPPGRAAQAVRLIERALSDGPMERGAIGRMLAGRDLVPGGQALVHLLFQSGAAGATVRGPMVGGRQTFVLTRDWLGTSPAGELRGADRDRALAELARRYLRGHGPATPADLALWAGLPLRDAHAGFAAIGGELREFGSMAMLIRGTRRTAEPPPRLLGAFDAYTLGWKDREFAVPAVHSREVRRDGWIKAVVTVSGSAIGVWSSRTSGRRMVVAQRLWDQPSADDARLLLEDAAALARFEGLDLG